MNESMKIYASQDWVVENIKEQVTSPAEATVGQSLIVKSVDENGKPIEWEYADVKGTSSWNDLEDKPTKLSSFENDTNYATETFVTNKIAEAELGGEEVDLSGYATKDDIKDFIKEVPAEYVTETELEAKGYLTQHQDISGKLDASKLPEAINTALSQAKESGEFDGKKGADGYSVYISNSRAGMDPDGIFELPIVQIEIPSGREIKLWDIVISTATYDIYQVNGLINAGTVSVTVIGNIKGADGKTAYQYAKQAGYTGTESEFATRMATKVPTQLSELTADATHRVVTDTEKTSWNNKADLSEGSIFVTGSGTTDSTAKTSTWVGTSDKITSYKDGLAIRYKIGVAGQTTTTLNINNLGAKPVYLFNTTKLTTQFPVGSIINLIYHTDLNSGCWMCSDYDSNTNTYQRIYPSTNNVEYPITARYNTTTGSNYYAEYGRYSTGVTLNPSTNTITATNFKGTATKATGDGDGNNIASTYAKKANAETWTFTLEDGTTVTKKVVLA